MTQPHPTSSSAASVRHAPVSLPGRPAPRHLADRANPPVRPGPAGTLVVAGVLQAGQALLWLLTGLLIGFGNTDVNGDPATVVLVIAAAGSLAVGVFVLALAAGTISRSDVCRIASLPVQAVSAAFVAAACVRSIGHRRGLLVRLAPDTGPAFLVPTDFLLAMLALCVAVLTLLLCGRSASVARRR